MIDFPIIDTHLHLWDPNALRYPWLDDLPSLNKPLLLDEYRRACATVMVEKMVFLQCEVDPEQYREEVDFVTALAQQDARIQGIVSWAPLEKGEGARAEVEALSQNSLVKGIRRIIQFEEDPSFCLQPDFVRGVQLLAGYGLHFEICIKGDEQFRNTLSLVRQCPDVRFILNHIGKPFIKEGVLDPWRDLLRELAGLPNTWCKLSGLATEADAENWTREDLKPYIEWVLTCFGWDRVIYGGDWPVATLATDLPRWVETLSWAAEGTPEQMRHLFYDNAARYYRL